MTWIDWERESDLVNDLKAGLEAALSEVDAEISGRVTEIPGWNEENVKINKLVHRVIDSQNLPILTTWFKYGQYEPHEELSPVQLSPRPLTAAPVTPSEPSVPHRNYPSPEEIKGYFLEMDDFEFILEQDMYEFLRDNYENHSPEEYRRVYLANLDVLRILDEFAESDILYDDSIELESQLNSVNTRLRAEIIANPRFGEDIENTITKFLHRLQDAIVVIESRDELTEEQLYAVSQARKVYHEYIWRWPSMRISTDKASGVDADRFKEMGRKEIRELEDTAPQVLRELIDCFEEAGLVPDSRDYRSVQAAPDESIQSLERASIWLG